MNNYYIPQTRRKALEILSTYYPDDKSLRRCRKKQLIAILLNTRKKIVAGMAAILLIGAFNLSPGEAASPSHDDADLWISSEYNIYVEGTFVRKGLILEPVYNSEWRDASLPRPEIIIIGSNDVRVIP